MMESQQGQQARMKIGVVIMVKIDFLKKETERIEKLSSMILSMQDMFACTADLEDVEHLSSALETLKEIVDNIPCFDTENLEWVQ